MAVDLRISDEERTLIVELLEHEQDELPSELRRTRTSQVRERLRHREATVRDLLEKVKGMGMAA